MRVLIAGGNGFVGRALTRELQGAGHSVGWLSHRPGRAATLGFPGINELAFVPHSENEAWVSAVADADAVVNLSGYPIASRWNAKVKHLIRESRIETNRALVRALVEAAEADPDRARVLVTASGIGIYGERGDEVLTEASAPGDDWLSRVAIDWEAATQPASDAGVRVAAVRTAVVLGREGVLPRMLLPMRLFMGGPIGSGRQYLAWIHLADLVGIYRYVIEHASVAGPVNACAPEQLTMAEFARALGKATHRPSWFPVPAFVLSVILGEVAPYTLFSQRATSAKIADAGYTFRFPDAVGALTDAVAHMRDA